MEQHPVPQNITGFQFKLIGDMTIKQFLFVAGGVLSGYLALQLGLPGLIKWFLAACLGGAGFAFAFIPIEERPLDRWFISFFRNVYSPTQFLWKKKAVPPEILTLPVPTSLPPTPETLRKEGTAAKIEEYLQTLPGQSGGQATINILDQQETSFLSGLTAFFGQTSKAPVEPAVAPPGPRPSVGPWPGKPAVGLEKETKELTAKINTLQQELSSQTISQQRFIEIQAQLNQLLVEKERLTKELVSLKQTLATKEKEEAVKPTAAAQAPEEPRVKIITPSLAPKMGMLKPPTMPNVPSGIVKTQGGAILANILIEIRNQEGTPVRALKTGKLGQFTIATPLANGTYTIHPEDPQGTYFFDIIEINLNGQIISPLEIFAKTEKDKVKEELKKKLFGPDNF